jgi:hypothetical protein
MTASNSDYMQRADQAETLLAQARQMILPGKDSMPISEWLDSAADIIEVVQIFAGALADGSSSREAWDATDTDADEFVQTVNYLDAPRFLDDVYGDSVDASELSDLSRKILQDYADRLETVLSSLHGLLLKLSEDLAYGADLADVVAG